MYNEKEGDLIELALQGEFDVIVHGCNCFCTMGAGIALQMKNTFSCNEFFLENEKYKGNINKLGSIDFEKRCIIDNEPYPLLLSQDNKNTITIVNAYTQYTYGKNHLDGKEKPIDYEALTLCLRKINHIFKGKKIGLPQIGSGLAGGEWGKIKQIIKRELFECKTIIIFYNK